MPATKTPIKKQSTKRINISPKPDDFAFIKELAKRDGVTVTTKASQLIHLALEWEEDIMLSALAEERLNDRAEGKSEVISHDEFWKDLK